MTKCFNECFLLKVFFPPGIGNIFKLIISIANWPKEIILFYDPEGLKLPQVRLVSENILDQSLICCSYCSAQGPQGELPLTLTILITAHLCIAPSTIITWRRDFRMGDKNPTSFFSSKTTKRQNSHTAYLQSKLRGAEVHLTVMWMSSKHLRVMTCWS